MAAALLDQHKIEFNQRIAKIDQRIAKIDQRISLIDLAGHLDLDQNQNQDQGLLDALEVARQAWADDVKRSHKRERQTNWALALLEAAKVRVARSPAVLHI